MKPLLILMLVLLAGCASTANRDNGQRTSPLLLPVAAAVETQAVETGGDAADDPAIWINPEQPEQSRILATQKQSGLYVYDLNGRQRQYLPVGRVNNVDLRQGITLPSGLTVDLAAASNRSSNTISLFTIDQASGQVSHQPEWETRSGLKEVYGLCMGRWPAKGKLGVIVVGKSGAIEVFKLAADSQSGLKLILSHQLRVPSQAEGCVVDDSSGELFVGEENGGIWRFLQEQPGQLIIPLDGKRLVADVEGLGLFYYQGQRFLIASSQGSDAFPIYRLDGEPEYRLSLQIIAGEKADAVSGTDGLEITSSSLGGNFSQGLLVVQDDENSAPTANQNFKLLPISAVLRSLQRE